MSSSREISIIEYYGAGEGHKCGYCKGLKSSLSSGRLIFFQYDYVSNVVFVHHVFFPMKGMWAHSLNCIDYQNLIDRGWRRSGMFIKICMLLQERPFV